MKDVELFSPRERRILKALGRKKMRLVDLVESLVAANNAFFPDQLLDNNSLAGSVRRINRKCEYHKLPWFLNGCGVGRQGKTIWRDKR